MFGTLIEIDSPLKLVPGIPYCIQLGRTVMTIIAKEGGKIDPKPQEFEESRRYTEGRENDDEEGEDLMTISKKNRSSSNEMIPQMNSNPIKRQLL